MATRVVLDEGVGPYASAALRSSLAAVVVLIFLFARRVQINRRPESGFCLQAGGSLIIPATYWRALAVAACRVHLRRGRLAW